jgi:large subunit ribosomal protein L31e
VYLCRRNEDEDAKEEMYAFVTVPKDPDAKGKQTVIVDEKVA